MLLVYISIYCTLCGHARERAVIGFIPNSCYVEGSYNCFMAYLALIDALIER